MNDWVAIALLVILLAGNAFFVAGEFAIMSTRRAQIEPLAEEGNKRAQTVIYALENVSLMLATCQLGITCLLYTSPSPRDQRGSRMPSSA